MSEGRLFIISGPSGTGKGTICKALVERIDIDLSVSMTTRKIRQGEVPDESYYFTSKDEFKRLISEDGFLEYAEVYENYYGTPKNFVLEKLEKGRDVVLEIDIQGALKVKENFKKGVFIFILPPSMGELRKRITGRGSETEESLNLRLGETLKEVDYIDKYDYCVVNDQVYDAVEKICAIISAEHCKVSQDVYKLIRGYKEEI